MCIAIAMVMCMNIFRVIGMCMHTIMVMRMDIRVAICMVMIWLCVWSYG